MMAGKTVWPQIVAHLRKNPGTEMRTKDVSDALGMPMSTVSGALSRAIERGLYPELSQPRHGYWLWGKRTYAPDRKPIAVGTLLECIGVTETGDAVVKDEADCIYVVRPVK